MAIHRPVRSQALGRGVVGVAHSRTRRSEQEVEQAPAVPPVGAVGDIKGLVDDRQRAPRLRLQVVVDQRGRGALCRPKLSVDPGEDILWQLESAPKTLPRR